MNFSRIWFQQFYSVIHGPRRSVNPNLTNPRTWNTPSGITWYSNHMITLRGYKNKHGKTSLGTYFATVDRKNHNHVRYLFTLVSLHMNEYWIFENVSFIRKSINIRRPLDMTHTPNDMSIIETILTLLEYLETKKNTGDIFSMLSYYKI